MTKHYPIDQIIQGDCLNEMKKMSDNQFDLVLTDPPYGKTWTTRNRGKNPFGSSNHLNETSLIEWDKFTPTQEYFDEMQRVSKNQIIFGGNYFTDKLPISNCWIVWDKVGQHKFNNPFAQAELAWTSYKRTTKKFTLVQQGFVSETNDDREHPTQKPTELLKQIIRDFAKPGHTILDPFAGSGSTLRASKDLGRKCTVIEINPKYIEIIKKRERQEVLL